MDEKEIIKIIQMEKESIKILEDSIFKGLLSDLNDHFIDALKKRFDFLNEGEDVHGSDVFKEIVICEAESISKKAKEFMEKYKQSATEHGFLKEFAEYIENISSFLQIVVNFYITPNRELYKDELKKYNFDIEVILKKIYREHKRSKND